LPDKKIVPIIPIKDRKENGGKLDEHAADHGPIQSVKTGRTVPRA
jgi:hypothetical protein